jgi:hypothetical protein
MILCSRSKQLARDAGKPCGSTSGRRVARDLVLSRRNPQVAIVNAGKSPITEPGLDGLVARAVGKRLLSATKDASRYLDSCAMAIVCVGTPGASDRSHNMSFVVEVSHQIAELVGPARATTLTDAFRSTLRARHDRGTGAPDFRGRRELDRDLDEMRGGTSRPRPRIDARNVETAQT